MFYLENVEMKSCDFFIIIFIYLVKKRDKLNTKLWTVLLDPNIHFMW